MNTCLGPALASWLLVLTASASAGAAKPAGRMDLYGDPLPVGALARMGTVRLRNPGSISRIVFAPDGRTLASWHGGQGGTLCLWEAGTGRELRRVSLPHARLYDLRLLPDGRSVAVLGNAEGAVFLWDFASGREPAPALGPAVSPPPGAAGDQDQERFGFFTVSPDGKILAGGSYGFTNRKRFIRLWEVATGKALGLLKVHRNLDRNQGVLQWLAFLPDGRTLVSASPSADSAEDMLTFWDVGSGKEVRHIRTPLAYRHDVGAAVAFPVEGNLLALGLQDTTVRLWDVTAGKELRVLRGHERRGGLGTIFSVAFAPDGKTLASAGSDRTVRLWDRTTGKQRLRWEDQPGRVEALAFSPDGRILAAGGHDGTIHLFEVGTDKVAGPPGQHQGGVASLALSPDGKTLATSDGDGVRLWETATGRERRHLPAPGGWTTILGYVDGGRGLRCATSGQRLRVWDALAAKEVRAFEEPASAGARVLAVTPDGKTVATVSDGATRLWEVETGKQRPITVARSNAFAATLAPHAQWFAIAGLSPPGIHLWQIGASELKQRLLPPHRDMVLALAFSPEGTFLASGGRLAGDSGLATPGDDAQALGTAGCALLLWQVKTARLARRCTLGPPGATDERAIDCVAFSPDGRALATGEADGTVSLYETATGRRRRRLTRHQDRVMALAFSADGRRLASGSQDHTALVCDLLGESGLASIELSEVRLKSLWADLAEPDAARAYQAVSALVRFPQGALPFLKSRLRPAGPLLPPGRLAQLLEDLDGQRYAVRARAAADLEALGEVVEPALREALGKQPSLEKKRRLEPLLVKLERPWERLLPAEQLRQRRALEVLEMTGGRASQEILQVLASGAPEVWLTQEARASLARLKVRAAGGP